MGRVTEMAAKSRGAQSRTRDADGYPLAPVDVSETCWLYGEAKGLTVVQEERDIDGKHVRTLQSLIPWSKIEAAQSRKQK